MDQQVTRFQVAGRLVQPTLNTVTGPDGDVRLEPKVMQVLVCLAEHAGDVVPKEHFFRTVWADTFVTDDVLVRAISELRRVFRDDPKGARVIATVPKGGYRLVVPVTPNDAESLARTPAEAGSVARRFVSWISASRTAQTRWTLGALTVIAFLAVAVYWSLRPELTPRVTRVVKLTNAGSAAIEEWHREVVPGLVTDGSRIYFKQFGTRGVSVVSVSGGLGSAIEVPSGRDLRIHDLSRDGMRLLVGLDMVGESALWEVPTSGRGTRRVGDLAAHAAAWSADGAAIYYSFGTNLFAIDREGVESRKLCRLPSRAFCLRVSPAGGVLRMRLRDAETNTLSLWEVDTDGTKLHRVNRASQESFSEGCGNWTSDGRYFVYSSDRNGHWDLWIRREGRSLFDWREPVPQQLTTGPLEFFFPTPSTDGKSVLAVGAQARVSTVTVDAKSGQLIPMPQGLTGNVRFSRDGNWIAASDDKGLLWRMRADGTDRLRLTSEPMTLLGYFNWSPNGDRIAFMGKLPGKPWKIYLVSRDGGNVQPLVHDERAEADPTWAADGLAILFGRLPEYMAEAGMPKDVRRVDLRTGAISSLPGSDGLFSPHVSPDGRYVVAQNLRQDRMLLFDADTKEWTVLASRQAHSPIWSFDSQYVYAQDRKVIWRARISDRTVEDMWTIRPQDGGCELAGLGPDNTIILLRVGEAGGGDTHGLQAAARSDLRWSSAGTPSSPLQKGDVVSVAWNRPRLSDHLLQTQEVVLGGDCDGLRANLDARGMRGERRGWDGEVEQEVDSESRPDVEEVRRARLPPPRTDILTSMPDGITMSWCGRR